MVKKIYVNFLLFTIIIVSYVSLLFFISNEGFKNTDIPVENNYINTEIINTSINYQEADIKNIKINKSLLEIE